MEGLQRIKRIAAAAVGFFGAHTEEVRAREFNTVVDSPIAGTTSEGPGQRLPDSFQSEDTPPASSTLISFEDPEQALGRGSFFPRSSFADAASSPIDIEGHGSSDGHGETIEPGIGFRDGVTYTRENGDQFQIEGNRREIRIGYKKPF